MEKSVSDLFIGMEKMWSWLTDNPNKKLKSNHSKSQYAVDFQNRHLERAFLRITEIMRYSHNLSSKRLNEIFTAQTLESFLKLILQDYAQYPYKNFKHDFRTTEIARMMFEMSAEYLNDSTITETVRSDLNRVSDHFITQSLAALQMESHIQRKSDTGLTKKQEDELLSEHEILVNSYYKLYYDKKVQELINEYRKINSKISKLQLNTIISANKDKKKTEINKQEIIKLVTKQNQISEQLRKIEHDLIDEIIKTENKLDIKYEHLSKYYSCKKFLPQFLKYIIEKKQAIPEVNDKSPMLCEPSVDGISGFAVPMKFITKNPLTLEDRKYLTSPEFHFRILREYDDIKWLWNQPCVNISELRNHSPLNRFYQRDSIVPISSTRNFEMEKFLKDDD